MAWNEAKAEASLLEGIQRNHPEILEVIGIDGTDEIGILPLRQFEPLWLNATSLPKGCTLTDPPTQSKPVHQLITSSEFELLAKYSRNSIYFFKIQILDGLLFYEAIKCVKTNFHTCFKRQYFELFIAKNFFLLSSVFYASYLHESEILAFLNNIMIKFKIFILLLSQQVL